MNRKDTLIVPSLFSKSLHEFKRKYEIVKDLGDVFQIDIMDGKFVDGVSVSIYDLGFLRSSGKRFEVHLMCEKPEMYLEMCRKIGAWRVLFHYEACTSDAQVRLMIDMIKKDGFGAGIVVNPETSFDEIIPYIGLVDVVMFMGVHPGAEGQPFEMNTYEKVRNCRMLSHVVDIEVDGGVKADTAERLAKFGCNIFCAGSFISGAKEPERNYRLLERVVKRLGTRD